jgi:tetratricopeptide (TPR) repeat protein
VSFVALLFLTYSPAWHGGLLWDDDHHLTTTRLAGLSGLAQIWFHLGATQQYYPVTHSFFWLENHLWGGATLGYHLVSIALHAASAIMLFVALRRLQVPGAWLAAAIFALHPMQVESVAWMSELKNTLSGFFLFASLLNYLEFDDTRRRSSFAMALVLYVASLLSKTTAIVLPFGLFAIVWWRRGSLSPRRDIYPLVPFVLCGISAGVLTAWVERVFIGAGGSDFQVGFVGRAGIAAQDIFFYVAKFVWPVHLAFVYPRWNLGFDNPWPYAAMAGVAILAVALWRRWERLKGAVALSSLFVICLGPSLGFVDVFPFRYSFVADHFAYLALAVASVAAAVGMARAPQRIQVPIGIVVIATLAMLSWRQAHVFASSAQLYQTTLSENPGCWLCENNLAALALAESDRGEEVVLHARNAVALRPNYPEAHANLAAGLERLNQWPQSLQEYRIALDQYADTPHDFRVGQVYHGLGRALAHAGRSEEALDAYRQALTFNPSSAATHLDTGLAFVDVGDQASATKEFRSAAALEPTLFEARVNLGAALLASQSYADAASELEEAVRLQPTSADAQFDLGVAYEQLQRPEKAYDHFVKAAVLDPACVPCRQHAAQTRGHSGR